MKAWAVYQNDKIIEDESGAMITTLERRYEAAKKLIAAGELGPDVTIREVEIVERKSD